MTLNVLVNIQLPSTAPEELVDRARRLALELGAAGVVDQVTVELIATCRECGCTDDEACLGGCWWIADDLCSSCGSPA